MDEMNEIVGLNPLELMQLNQIIDCMRRSEHSTIIYVILIEL